MVNVVTKDNFNCEVIRSSKPVVVDFFATWCPPCKNFEPIFNQLSQEMPDIKFVKVCVDKDAELASQYNVMSIPTLVIFKEGKPVGKELPSGFDIDTLKSKIRSYL